MKTTLSPFICILICLLPTLTVGQAPQEQVQPQPPSLLQGGRLLSSRQMTGSPLLRLSNTGPMGDEGIRLDLTSLPMLDPGPALFMDSPDPMDPNSGSIRLQPSMQPVYARIEDIGSGTIDAIHFDIGPVIVAPYRPRIVLSKPKIGGLQSALYFEPGENTPKMRLTNFGAGGLGGLRIQIGNPPGLPSFFDVFYDTGLGLETHAFSNASADLLVQRKYDLGTSKLLDRMFSTNPTLENFFDISYDVLLGDITTAHGDEDTMFIVGDRYNKSTASLQRKMTTTLPSLADYFFDFDYNLNQGKETKRYGNLVSDVSLVRTYDRTTPKMTEHISNSDVMYNLRDYFLVYDMVTGLATISHRKLVHAQKFEPTPPKLTRSITSEDPAYAGHIYLESYSLSPLEGKQSWDDFHEKVTIEKEIPRIKRELSSSNPGLTGRVYTTSYDLGWSGNNFAGCQAYNDLYSCQYMTPGTQKLERRLYATAPGAVNSFSEGHDLIGGIHYLAFADPVTDLIQEEIFDKSAGIFRKKIRSTNPIYLDNTFITSYSLPALESESSVELLFEKIKFFPESHTIRKTVGSAEPGYTGPQFKSEVNLDTGQKLESMADFHHIHDFDYVTPELLQGIYKDGLLARYEIGHNLSLGTETRSFGPPGAQVLLKTKFDPAGPRITQTYASLDPMHLASFFDVTFDLPAGEVREEYKGMKHVMQYHEADFSFISRYTDVDLPVLFQHEHKLFITGNGGEEKSQFQDLSCSDLFYPNTPRLVQLVASSNPMFADDAFRTTYDLAAATYELKNQDKTFTITASEPSTICWRFDAEIPAAPGHVETCFDLGSPTLQTVFTKAGANGIAEFQVEHKYDGITRLITEKSTDLDNMSSLTLEKRLSPGTSTLKVGGNLEVTGAFSNPGGPLLLPDDVLINGSLQVIGPKMFRIDHPLDPENKYLIHSCVESPDMMNVYNGNSITDDRGLATVMLPDYFEALNKEFRYQLTCIGQFAQVMVLKKIQNNQFVIQTDKPNVEVSWQVTGVRKDPAALSYGYAVVVDK